MNYARAFLICGCLRVLFSLYHPPFMPGTLYLVATPIGNLQDITFRAVETLRAVNVIACEDTRHTRKLLNHYRISNEVVSYHEHNEHERAEELADRLVRGDNVAVVSDAGTPGISDPGYQVVRQAIEIGAEIVPIPGPVAFVAAVIAAGMSTDSIFFGGFLPSKQGERRRRLSQLAGIPATLVFYEAPHRLARSLPDCIDVLGDRKAAVARELTKLHEQISRGKLSDLAQTFLDVRVKGEIVLVIDQAGEAPTRQAEPGLLSQRLAELEKMGNNRKAALKQAAKEFGLSKSKAYALIESTKK